jgi:ubiquinone/menaquinone biosynthesis C-methylase UbiE
MDTLKRISNRLENHITYRLGYPQELITFLKKEGVLKSGMVIAEIGSGTGHSAELFLKERIVVYGIEPKKEMREAGERLLKVYPDFKSIDATAEHTTLEDESVDLIIIGQALHWFDLQKCKQEFKRILKKGVSSSDTQVVIIWNQRRTESTPFLKAYEDFIKMFATDYLLVNQKNRIEKIVNDFFDSLPANQEGAYKTQSFLYEQHFDLEGLKCFIQSSSYMPAVGHKDFDFMMSVLKKIFTRYQDQHNLLDKKGKVCIEYDTNIYYGNLN